MATPQTARVPTWARGLAAFEAETGEDFGGQTPEEAYGFTPDGSSTGAPGRIHGTSRQGDMSSLRAWRNRSSVGPSTTSADIDNRLQTQEGQRRGQRYSQWEGFMRNQRQPFHGEIRMGGDKKPWKYNAMTGKGEPMAANPAQTVGSSAATAGVIGSRSSESPALPAPTPAKTTGLPSPPMTGVPPYSVKGPPSPNAYSGVIKEALNPASYPDKTKPPLLPDGARQEGKIEGKRFSDWKASLARPNSSNSTVQPTQEKKLIRGGDGSLTMADPGTTLNPRTADAFAGGTGGNAMMTSTMEKREIPTGGSRGNSLAGRKKSGGADPEMMSERMAWVKSLGVNSKPYSTSAIRRVSN